MSSVASTVLREPPIVILLCTVKVVNDAALFDSNHNRLYRSNQVTGGCPSAPYLLLLVLYFVVRAAATARSGAVTRPHLATLTLLTRRRRRDDGSRIADGVLSVCMCRQHDSARLTVGTLSISGVCFKLQVPPAIASRCSIM